MMISTTIMIITLMIMMTLKKVVVNAIVYHYSVAKQKDLIIFKTAKNWLILSIQLPHIKMK